VDVDATLHTAAGDVDFDDGPLGDVDGQTWETMQEVPDLPQDRPHVTELEDELGVEVPDTDTDVCVVGDVVTVECF
jgi:hypothetical protein